MVNESNYDPYSQDPEQVAYRREMMAKEANERKAAQKEANRSDYEMHYWRPWETTEYTQKAWENAKMYQDYARAAGSGWMPGMGQDERYKQSQAQSQNYGKDLLRRATGKWGAAPQFYTGSMLNPAPAQPVKQASSQDWNAQNGNQQQIATGDSGIGTGGVNPSGMSEPSSGIATFGGNDQIRSEVSAGAGGKTPLIQAPPAGQENQGIDISQLSEGPSAAQNQYIEGVRNQMNNALSVARSSRGQGVAAARQAVAGAQSQAAMEGSTGLGALRAQEQDFARNQYSQFVNDQRNMSMQDYFGRMSNQQDMMRFYEELASRQRQSGLGGAMSYDQMVSDQYMQDYMLQQRKRAQDEANEFNLWSDVVAPVLGVGTQVAIGSMTGKP